MRLTPAGWVTVLLLITGLLAAGCNERRHYKVLSFFFDGVPDPNAPAATADAPGSPAAQARFVQATYIYHQPYVQRQCAGCHDPTQSFDNIQSSAAMCQSCHASHVEPVAHDWVHGAVVFGDCGRCHEPHYSEHPGLLKATQPQICFDCHDPNFVKEDPYHRHLDDVTCSRCHDPHASGNRLLLVDSRSYQRRGIRTLASEHSDWTREQCNLCHRLDQGNVVIEDVTPVCQGCHPNVMQAPEGGGKLHQAVLDGKCITCHDPHRSIRPALIRPTAEKICVGCHNPEELPRPEHPVVIRGDCLMCHQGHVSDRPALLRPNISLRRGARSTAASPWTGSPTGSRS